MMPERRGCKKSREERRNRKIPERYRPGIAGPLLLSLFGEFSSGFGEVPKKTAPLLREGCLFSRRSTVWGGSSYQAAEAPVMSGSFIWQQEPAWRRELLNTQKRTSSSPVIRPENVGGAEVLITATLTHYTFSKFNNLAFAFDEEGEFERTYLFSQELSLSRGEFEEVRESLWAASLLLKGRSGLRPSITKIDLWKRANGEGIQQDYYTLEAGFDLVGISLDRLLQRLVRQKSS